MPSPKSTTRKPRTTEPREFVRPYRGGVVRCFPAVGEYYAEFDGQPLFPEQPSEVMAQRLIDDKRLDMIEAGLLTPDQTDLDSFAAASQPAPPAPAGARVLWQWEGSARMLRAVIAERRQLGAA